MDNRSRIVIELKGFADNGFLKSRSLAKSIMATCRGFDSVTLDFQGVEFIAPSFADEIFRIWRRMNPGVTLDALGTDTWTFDAIQKKRSEKR